MKKYKSNVLQKLQKVIPISVYNSVLMLSECWSAFSMVEDT